MVSISQDEVRLLTGTPVSCIPSLGDTILGSANIEVTKYPNNGEIKTFNTISLVSILRVITEDNKE